MRILPLCLMLSGLLVQDKGLRKVEWKLASGHAAEYVCLDKAGKPMSDQKFLIFASELTAHSNRIKVDAYEEIPIAMLFQLPPEAFKTSLGWEFTGYFFNEAFDSVGGYESMVGGGSIRPVAVKGRYIVKTQKKGEDEIAHIEGAFSLFEIRRDFVNNQSKIVLTKNDLGTLATSAQVSVSRGVLLKGGWQLRARGQEREGGRPADKKIETQQMIELKEDVELDAAKLQPSVEGSLVRAVDWLKKQQKNGAWTPARANPTPGDTIHLTALVVRALIAAGVKPDDPAIVAAAKTLRSPAPQENAALAQQILALCCKTPTKDEADDARKLADELHQRRDPDRHGWGAGVGRGPVPNLTLTSLALDALASVPDSKIPEETFKAGLEIFTGSWVDVEGAVDLDIEFEKDAATIAADPKKDVQPVIWPALLSRGGGLDFRSARKGSFFTLVASLRAMLVLSGKMKLDEKQLKAVDWPLRRGLANLQLNWTFRTVPPVEAPWCAQRLEYMGVLAPMLSQARIDRIGGSDWRLEGATLLLREQGNDGSWYAGTDQAVAKTAHALLFLGHARR
jgi:hypothetical protein